MYTGHYSVFILYSKGGTLDNVFIIAQSTVYTSCIFYCIPGSISPVNPLSILATVTARKFHQVYTALLTLHAENMQISISIKTVNCKNN